MIKAPDGAWISETKVSRFECTCGWVEVTRFPKNDREADEIIAAHIRDKHWRSKTDPWDAGS